MVLAICDAKLTRADKPLLTFRFVLVNQLWYLLQILSNVYKIDVPMSLVMCFFICANANYVCTYLCLAVINKNSFTSVLIRHNNVDTITTLWHTKTYIQEHKWTYLDILKPLHKETYTRSYKRIHIYAYIHNDLDTEEDKRKPKTLKI